MLIAFVGSVFSPYYARARARAARLPAAPAAAESHVAFNLALVPLQPGAGRAAWTMTERGSPALYRRADELAIGPSRLRWFGDGLQVDLDEWGLPWPWPSRVRGRIRLWPQLRPGLGPQPLDPSGRHRWWPIAPRARVEVDLAQPGLRWSGDGYLDSNRGPEPLDRPFHHWQWARAALADGEAAVVYQAEARQRAGSKAATPAEPADRADPAAPGEAASWAWRFDRQGRAEPFTPPPSQAWPATGWRLRRSLPGGLPAGVGGGLAAGTDGGLPTGLGGGRLLQDAPFYARSLLPAEWCGQRVLAMHEHLDLDRLRSPWVQAMLPFRMPRRAGG